MLVITIIKADVFSSWYLQKEKLNNNLTCVAGGISVGVLSCFGGGAARRMDEKKKYPGKRIPPATHVNKKLKGKEHQENSKRRAVRGVLCII